MADSFQNLLNSIGFGAADAAAETGLIQRKLELGRDMAGNDADDKRRNLATDYESRGVSSSGEANLGYARLEADSANVLSGLDIAAADSTLAVQRRLEQEKAQKEANDRALALQQQLAEQQFALSREQMAAQLEQTRQIEQARTRAAAAAQQQQQAQLTVNFPDVPGWWSGR